MRKKATWKHLILSFVLGAWLSSCGEVTTPQTDIQETAQQIGDVMASIDEAGGSSGVIARSDLLEPGLTRLLARRDEGHPFTSWMGSGWHWLTGSSAFAQACATSSTFGTCSGSSITRTFSGCSIGGATLTGTVVLQWSGASCSLATSGESISRSPSFSMTGRRGATLTVSKVASYGQRLTWQSGTGATRVFAFENDGIRRVLSSGSNTLFDYTTTTPSALTVTGTHRSYRVINGGTLRVTDNQSGTTCDFTPSNVSWSPGCNCPDSGTWSATCSDGKSASLFITGCGQANYTLDGASESLTFDRCYSL